MAPVEARPAEPEQLAPAWHVLADGRACQDPSAPPDLRRVLLAVAGASLLCLLGLLAVAAYAGREAAQTEALRDVRAHTELLATAVLAPALTDAVVRGDPEALAELDELVRDRVLVEPVVRLKVWDSDGRVVYSDQPELIGEVYPLAAEEAAALRQDATTSGFADLREAEHRLDGLRDRMLEVYTPVRTRGGQPLLVETYSRFSLVTARQADVLQMFLPILVGAMVLLQLT
ncbi:MAG: hypothetical protein AVDCRST_MAG16-2791, partial [uncultured Frankineae bacterium]